MSLESSSRFSKPILTLSLLFLGAGASYLYYQHQSKKSSLSESAFSDDNLYEKFLTMPNYLTQTIRSAQRALVSFYLKMSGVKAPAEQLDTQIRSVTPADPQKPTEPYFREAPEEIVINSAGSEHGSNNSNQAIFSNDQFSHEQLSTSNGSSLTKEQLDAHNAKQLEGNLRNNPLSSEEWVQVSSKHPSSSASYSLCAAAARGFLSTPPGTESEGAATTKSTP